MDRSNPGTHANRWFAHKVVDLGKVPMKFFLVWGLYSAVAIIAILVFFSAFSSGIVFGIPVDFAVDNEERVYLSYDSGVYVVDQGIRYAIWPDEKNAPALSVSEDDMLTIANTASVRVADLTRSDLESGRLEIVKSYFAPDNVLYSIGMDQHDADPQNGATYRLQSGFNNFEIYREKGGKSELFYSMPRSDRAWTLAARIGFILWFPYVLSAILLWSIYSKRHPEYVKKAPYLWKKRTE